MDKFAKMKVQSRLMNETNDCAVIATALACKAPYKKVHALYKKHGRRDRCGTPMQLTYRVVGELGYKLVVSRRFKAKTGITLSREVKGTSGRYIAWMTTHLAAIVTGELQDWTHSSRKRVNVMFKVEKAS